MKYLVTGGAGFIGSHVVDSLIGRGHQVVVVDDLSSGHRDNLTEEVVFCEGDIRDSNFLKEVFESERPERVIHLAAQLSVTNSVNDPVFDAEVNIMSSIRLLNLCRAFSVQKIVLASSAGTVYGDKSVLPVEETVDTYPECPYGISKLAMEKYAHFYYLSYQMPYVALRLSNVYGPRQNPHGEAGVVAIFTNQMLSGKDCFINGDGLNTRDFIYVGDVVEAFMVAMEEDLIGEYNISRGIQTNILTIGRLLKEFTGYEKDIMHREGNLGEQRHGQYSSNKFQQATGWTPIVSIEEGLKSTVESFRN